MDLEEHVRSIFAAHYEVQKLVVHKLLPSITKAATLLAKCLSKGNKILTCGNGGSACDAGHFTAEIANRFLVERDGMPAITLGTDYALMTAIANDYTYKYVFSRQIKALANPGDMLLAISTSGNSLNILEAVQVGHECQMEAVVLSGKDGGNMTKILTANDIEIRIPDAVTPRIQEMHTVIIHCLCELIDKIRLGG